MKLWPHHVSEVVHAQAVGVRAHGMFQVVQLDLLQVLLPNHSPPALLLLQGKKGGNLGGRKRKKSHFFSLFNLQTKMNLWREGKKSRNDASPHGISLYASSSTVPSARPAGGPDWGRRGRRSGTGPAQLQAASWLPIGKQSQESELHFQRSSLIIDWGGQTDSHSLHDASLQSSVVLDCPHVPFGDTQPVKQPLHSYDSHIRMCIKAAQVIPDGALPGRPVRRTCAVRGRRVLWELFCRRGWRLARSPQ